MRINPLTILLILLFPFFDLYVLIKVGSYIGASVAIFLVVFTSFLGFFLLKHQGVSTIARMNRAVREGEPPARPLVEGVILVFGAFLLLIPGFISDFFGLLTLVPWFRAYIWKRMARHSMFNVEISSSAFEVHVDDKTSSKQGSRTIEGDYKRED